MLDPVVTDVDVLCLENVTNNLANACCTSYLLRALLLVGFAKFAGKNAIYVVSRAT